MIQTAAILSSGTLWQSVRREAESAVARDPLFGRTISAAILDRSGLGDALACQIAERLGRNAADAKQVFRVAREAFETSPDLVEAASQDLQSIAVHDPATTALLPPLLNFKGYMALQVYRVSNWLWRHERTDLALLLQSLSSDTLQVSIHPSASIGTQVFLDHGTGIIIGAFAIIGDGVTILQNVTIGRKQDLPSRSPRIGRGVYLGGGATILGDISIGDFAKIGAGALVQDDVPPGCTAVGVPAKLVNCADAG